MLCYCCCCSCCCCCARGLPSHEPPGPSARSFPASSLPRPPARLHGIALVTRPSFKGLHSSRLKDKLGSFSSPFRDPVRWQLQQSSSFTQENQLHAALLFFFFLLLDQWGVATKCVSSWKSKWKSLDSPLRRQRPDLFSRPVR